MDSHDERINPRPGQEPEPRSAEASARPIREPAGSGPGQGPSGSGQVPEPAGSSSVPGPAASSPAQDPTESSEPGTEQDDPIDTGPQREDQADPTGRTSQESQSDEFQSDEFHSYESQSDGHIAEESGRPPRLPAGSGTASPAVSGLGIGRLSFRYQVVAAVALAAIGVAACVHLGLVFLSVAPLNTMTKQHGEMVDDWVLPEFEQNWKLFAPNPLQQNIAVQARVEVRSASGSSQTTGWYNISALDGAAIDGNPLPSHTQQNELRRAWDFFVATHDNQNRPIGMRGELSESYLRRIIVLRLHRLGVGNEHAHVDQKGGAAKDSAHTSGGGVNGTVVRLQIRSMTTSVQPPRWSGTAPYSDKPIYRTLSWWAVTADDMALDAATGDPRPKDTKTEAISR